MVIYQKNMKVYGPDAEEFMNHFEQAFDLGLKISVSNKRSCWK